MNEPAGFREFVVARSPSLLRTAWMLTGNAATAEDLLQTALARTWPHWNRIANQRPEAYVRKILLRTHASWRLRRWHNETPRSDPGNEHTTHYHDEQHAAIDDRILLATALGSLPTRQRQAVVLRYFDDLSVEAVAEAMGCTSGTVKSQTAKGLAKLRGALASHDPRDADDDLKQVR